MRLFADKRIDDGGHGSVMTLFYNIVGSNKAQLPKPWMAAFKPKLLPQINT
jgi:hypothetical protein